MASAFLSHYRLLGLLGVGGMGEVHRATQLSLGRTVAVKLLATELAKDKTFVARFEKEAAAESDNAALATATATTAN